MANSKNITNLNLVKNTKKESSKVSALSPREIVSELDRYVIGQKEAKKAVAVALRNRWRRQALSEEMRDEVLPKNILMIGPTGVGKTEISRRLSKLAEAPFIKVEATRFTEVGYVGRDVEQIVRDLIEIAIAMERVKKRKEVKAKAELKAEEKVLDALVGNKASVATRESFRKRLRNGDLDNNEIEIEVNEAANMPSFEIPGISKDGIWLVSLTAISISLSSKSPSLSLFLKLSLVATLALFPTKASKTLSSANFWAWAWTSFLFLTFSIAIAISKRSLTICSTSRPTYPTSVNLVASTFTNGASANLESLLEISVLPTPVGPIIKIFFGRTSSFISSSNACRLHLFLKAIATALLALFCPTTNLSNSDTISLGDKALTFELVFFPLSLTILRFEVFCTIAKLFPL